MSVPYRCSFRLTVFLGATPSLRTSRKKNLKRKKKTRAKRRRKRKSLKRKRKKLRKRSESAKKRNASRKMPRTLASSYSRNQGSTLFATG